MGGDGTSNLDSDLGSCLALLRTGVGWTQAKLARRSGIPPGSISEYEAGKKLPELASLTRLLDAMQLGFADIDKARGFKLSLRLQRAPAQARGTEAAEAAGLAASLSEQVAAMASDVGAAVSRFTDAIALLVRERACGTQTPSGGPEADSREGSSPMPGDRERAAELWHRLRKYPSSAREVLIREAREFQNWALCERLCIESRNRAADDAAAAVQLATLAGQVAELAARDDLWAFKLRGFAQAFLGNALRVQGALAESEEAFRKSEEFLRAGAACEIDLLEEARVLDLRASLHRSQRRLGEALELLDQALAADRQGALTGHLLVKKAKTLEEMGELEAAASLLREAETHIDPQRDPHLFLCLRHNFVDYLSKLQRFEDAEALLPEVRALSSRQGNQLDILRLRWVEARVADGLGRTKQAIEILTQVRGEFHSRRMDYDTALVSLELAAIFAREGNTDQVKTLARHMTPIFQGKAISREALAALALFRKAAETEKVTAELATRLLDFLYRARLNPELRFEGSFEEMTKRPRPGA